MVEFDIKTSYRFKTGIYEFDPKSVTEVKLAWIHLIS